MPAFDEAAAREVIARELPSVRIGEAFKGGIPQEPVAAASLGQVVEPLPEPYPYP